MECFTDVLNPECANYVCSVKRIHLLYLFVFCILGIEKLSSTSDRTPNVQLTMNCPWTMKKLQQFRRISLPQGLRSYHCIIRSRFLNTMMVLS